MQRFCLLLLCGFGCMTETSSGTAAVYGHVSRTTGAPWASATVEILCLATGDTTRAETDSSGAFAVNLDFPGVVRGNQGTSTSCRFAVPSLQAPQAATTRVIGIYASLEPIQTVSLQEGSK